MRYVTAWDAIKWAAGMRGVYPSGQGGPAVGMSYAWMLAGIGFALGCGLGFVLARTFT